MKITSTLLSLIVAAAFSFQASTAKATMYIADTQANGTIGPVYGQGEWEVNKLVRGQFNVDLTTPSIYADFKNTQYENLAFTFTQTSAGTASYDETTRLFTLTDAKVLVVKQPGCKGKQCSSPWPYEGTLNLAFYLSEDLRDITAVPGANYITVLTSLMWESVLGVDYLSPPTRIDLDYAGTVPLPATAWLLGSGLLGLALRPKRSKNSRSI